MTKPDLSEFYKYSRPKKPPCQLGHARDQLDDSELVAALDAALDTDKGLITAGAVQQWLKDRSQSVTVPAIVAHRKGTCSCAEEG